MLRFFKLKPRNILILCLLLILGASIWVNKSNVQQEEPSTLPAIDAKDEAGRLVQKASENYFYHEYDQAAENYRKAIAIYEGEKNFQRAGKIYESLGDLYKVNREIESAKTNYQLAVGLHARVHNRKGEARALKRVGDLYMEQEMFQPAETWYEKAVRVIKDEEASIVQARVYEAVGQFYWETEKIPEAIDHFTHAQKSFEIIGYEVGFNHMVHVIQAAKTGKKQRAHSMESAYNLPPSHGVGKN